MNGYFVKLPVFEGPLDLLLWLVKNNNMDIYDIEISRITSQFLEYILASPIPPDAAGEFLSMATLLLKIKSSLMLPKETEEYQEAVEEKTLLEDRLAEWEKIKKSGELLLEKFRGRKFFLRRDEPFKIEVAKKPNFSVFDLAEIFAGMIKDKKNLFETVTGPEIYLEDVLKELSDRIKNHPHVRFSELAAANPRRLYIAVLLLAVLNLALKREISINQKKPFSEIIISRNTAARAKRQEANHGN
ncbi:MAG: segregation/condensation protein A [Elusimicrobia bacterium]|nr:segregation/condensation protein A [Elusimicrobiota bacterium]